MPKPAMVTGLLLAVAVLALAGLGSVAVPVGTTQTMIEKSTRLQVAHVPTLVVSINSQLTTISFMVETDMPGNGGTTWEVYCNPGYNNGYAVPCALTVELASTNVMWSTATISYSYTATRSITKGSTSLMPASVALGLTDGSFTALAVMVIGILALLMAYLTLKTKIKHRPKQVSLSQFVKVQSSCVKCGAELPHASEFCNKCGTKQTE